MSTASEFFFLFVIAVFGGVLNVTIGGAWFIVFPSLIYGGVQPVVGNATTMSVLLSSDITSSEVIKNGYELSKKNFLYMALSCSIGGLVGALLLVSFSFTNFEHIAPYLLLCSWFLFTFYDRILAYVRLLTADTSNFKYSHTMLFPIFLLGVYGGYFGAGMGMLIFVLCSYFGVKNDDTLKGLKLVLLCFNNGAALLIYICSGLVFWPFALIMITGVIVGGYVGVRIDTKINKALLKKIMVVVGAVVTIYFLNLFNVKHML